MVAAVQCGELGVPDVTRRPARAAETVASTPRLSAPPIMNDEVHGPGSHSRIVGWYVAGSGEQKRVKDSTPGRAEEEHRRQDVACVVARHRCPGKKGQSRGGKD